MKSEERAKKAVKSAVLFKFQGFRKKGKKVLTNGEGFGILTKLSARETAGHKRMKKPLDSGAKMW